MTYIQPGFDPTLNQQRMISTNAVTAGDIVVINEAVVDSTSKRFTTMKQPVTAELESGIFAVALEDIAAGAQGLFGFRGQFDCLTNGAIALLEDLGAVNTADYLDQTAPSAATVNVKIIAKPTETGTSALLQCIFNGIEGFGHDTGSTT